MRRAAVATWALAARVNLYTVRPITHTLPPYHREGASTFRQDCIPQNAVSCGREARYAYS